MEERIKGMREKRSGVEKVRCEKVRANLIPSRREKHQTFVVFVCVVTALSLSQLFWLGKV